MSDHAAMNGVRLFKLGAALALTSGVSGCVTTALAIGANAAVVAVSDKTAGSAIDDTAASAELRAKMVQGKGFSLGDVQIAVSEGFVLLTGTTPTPQDRIEAERRAWMVASVRNVANEITVGPARSPARALKDGGISAEVRSKFFQSTVKGINYNIETNLGTVYLLGIARSRYELTDAVEQARTVGGVQKVVSYVRVLERPNIERPETAQEAALRRAKEMNLQGGPKPDQSLPYGPDNPAPTQPDYAAYDAAQAADPYAAPNYGSSAPDPYAPTAKAAPAPAEDPYAPAARAAVAAMADPYAAPNYSAPPPPAYPQQPAYGPPNYGSPYPPQPPQQQAAKSEKSGFKLPDFDFLKPGAPTPAPMAPPTTPGMGGDMGLGGSPSSGQVLEAASDTFAGEVRPLVPDSVSGLGEVSMPSNMPSGYGSMPSSMPGAPQVSAPPTSYYSPAAPAQPTYAPQQAYRAAASSVPGAGPITLTPP